MEQINYEKIQIEVLITYREQMIVANKIGEMNGRSLKYNEDDFASLVNSFYNLLQG